MFFGFASAGRDQVAVERGGGGNFISSPQGAMKMLKWEGRSQAGGLISRYHVDLQRLARASRTAITASSKALLRTADIESGFMVREASIST
jgi:hypothetical protein